MEKMKRILLMTILLAVLLPLSAGFSPSLTLQGGAETLFYKENAYLSGEAGIDVSLLGYKFGCVTISLPLSVNYVTKSLSSASLLSPSYFKNGIGLEGLVETGKRGYSLAVYYGYEKFNSENALQKYIMVRAGFHVILNDYLSLVLPLSYTYTPSGSEAAFSIALRTGGEI